MLSSTDRTAPPIDPERAWANAIEAGMVVHRADPLNCEASIPALIGGIVVPNSHFYVRNHFRIPGIDPARWRLHVRGLVDCPLSLTLADLHDLPSRTMTVTLECAGNGRSGLEPPVDGEQWRLGAVGTAEWTGVPLIEVLDRAGVAARARELVFRGADGYDRSVQIGCVRETDALLAYAMNGEPLPVAHGAPLRLIVPRWYGMASVKWLTGVDAIDHPFDGPFQTGAYHDESEGERQPVTLQRVRSLITKPGCDDILAAGEVAIRGLAWSGAAPIARVDVSIHRGHGHGHGHGHGRGHGDEHGDADGHWQPARLLGDRSRHAWQRWELITRLEAGPTTIRVRATDLAGRTQPERPPWNRHGYCNNAIQPLHVEVAAHRDTIGEAGGRPQR